VVDKRRGKRAQRRLRFARPDGLVAGVDEAGRGPLAGPVVAAAVILDPRRRILGLRDSKVLAPERREVLAGRIRERALGWGIAWADPAEIDSRNILHATLMAMTRAVLRLGCRPGLVLVDGNQTPPLWTAGLDCDIETLVGGDDLVAEISAASILAKVHRDALMTGWHARFPSYGFDRHKGYGTADHLEALDRHGPCCLHRRSFFAVARAPKAATG
jgi:ribonuclease HII